MSDEITDAIRENATKPAKASGDGHSAEQHPLRDQIDADKYLRSQQAQAVGGPGIKLFKLIPPGIT